MNKLFGCKQRLAREIIKVIKHEQGATAIFMTMVILSAILVVSLSASNMVLKGMKYNKVRYDSAKAFYAAESGAEQIMWELRKNAMNPIPVASGYCNNNNPGDFCFDDTAGDINECVDTAGTCTAINSYKYYEMTNKATYSIVFDFESKVPAEDSITNLTSTGTYKDEVRKIKLTYKSGDGT